MARSRKKETLPERALRDLGDDALIDDPTVWAALCEDRASSVEKLRAAASDRTLHPKWRVHAALFLFRLEDAEAGAALAAALAHDDRDARAAAFEVLAYRMVFGGEKLEAAIASSAAVRDALDRALDDESAAVRAKVVPMTAKIPLPRLEERLVALLDDADLATRYFAAMQLIRRPDARAVGVLGAILADDAAKRWHHAAVVGLVDVLDRVRSPARDAAESALAAHFTSWDGAPPPPSQQESAKFLERAGAASIAAVRHLFRVSRDPWVRGHCLLAAVRLGANDADLDPRQHLRDWQLAPWAAAALARRHRGCGSAELVAEIEPTSSICAASERQRVLDAVLEIGGAAAQEAADRIVAKLAPSLKAYLASRRGQGPERCFARAVELGILAEPPGPDALRAAREESGEDADPLYFVLHVLDACGVLAFFGVEHDAVPVPHDDLVRLFAAKSGGRFQPENVVQTWNRAHDDDDEASYTVTFRDGDRDWSFDAESFRDCFDVEAIVRAVNAALEARGHDERFTQIDEAWLCARPDAAEAFAKELGAYWRARS